MLSRHPWPRRSVRPTSASRRSHWSAQLPLCLLQVSSTSAGPPILYGRLRPMAGTRPTGTERCRDARPLRAQRQGSLWCSERGCGAEQQPSQGSLGGDPSPSDKRQARTPSSRGVPHSGRRGDRGPRHRLYLSTGAAAINAQRVGQILSSSHP